MAHCHELGRVGRGLHCSLSFTIVEHGGPTKNHDESINRSASHLVVSVVGIHKKSDCHLFNELHGEIDVNLLYVLGVLFLEVFHQIIISPQVSSCDNGVSRVDHHYFVQLLLQLTKHPQGTFEVSLSRAGVKSR